MRRSGVGAFFFMAALATLQQVAAAEPDLKASVSGSLRGSYFTSSRELEDVSDLGSASLWLKTKASLDTKISFSAEGWGQRVKSSDTHKSQIKAREAYIDFNVGKLDLRLGKQIIAWGRADKLNPTDNLTPRDYTLQVIDDDDQRFGATAALLHLPLPGNEFVLTGAWLPRIKQNAVPIRRSPGVVFSEAIPNTDQYAIKLDRSGGEIDWSVSYLDGVNLNPELVLQSASSSGASFLMQHKRVRVLGMDAAHAVGRYGFRTEFAYTWTPVDADSTTTFTTKPFIYVVLGGDRTFDNGLNVNVQYFVYRISKYTDPRNITNPFLRNIGVENAVAAHQLESDKQGFSFRIHNKWLNDTLEAEITLVASFGTADSAIKPKLTYAINDQMRFSMGADIFRGHQDTFFGRLKDTSTGFAELKFSF